MIFIQIYILIEEINTKNHIEEDRMNALKLVKLLKSMLVVCGIEFIILGLSFALFGILTICAVKKEFKLFYRENVCVLSFATIGLSVPLLCRGSENLLRVYFPEVININKNEW